MSYFSQGSISFFEVGCLTPDDRSLLIDVIKKINEEEKEQAKSAQQTNIAARSPIVPTQTPKRFSSKSSIPKLPKI